jgi:LppP/LprE lipoprotein
MRRAPAMTCTILVLMALGGCGGGTKTVTVSGVATPTTTAASTATHTTAPARTTTSPPSTTTAPSSSPSAVGQGATTTHTAPEPAFTQHGGTSAGEATGEEAAAAVAVVKSQGYTPSNTAEYHPNQTLRVLVGTRTGSADGYDQRAFFFLDGKYIGTDASQPSASIRVVSQSDTEVALAYPLYRPHDPLCCPGGGQTTVHFQLNDGKLVPLQPIPPASSATGPSRQ